MAVNTGQRVVAFSLALLFLLSTIAAAAYVVWEVNREDTTLSQSVVESIEQQTNQTAEEQPVQQTISNFDGPVDVEELRYDIITQGDGEEVRAGDTVTIHYTGALASDGSVFDSSISRGEPAEFQLAGLIQGWQQGIPGMKVGETRRLYIPSELAYGAAGRGPSIPPNSDLIFDIELFATTR